MCMRNSWEFALSDTPRHTQSVGEPWCFYPAPPNARSTCLPVNTGVVLMKPSLEVSLRTPLPAVSLMCSPPASPGTYTPVISDLTQSCPTLCNPMDCSPPGSSVLGILEGRILEWVAISFSRGSCQPRDRMHISCVS